MDQIAAAAALQPAPFYMVPTKTVTHTPAPLAMGPKKMVRGEVVPWLLQSWINFEHKKGAGGIGAFFNIQYERFTTVHRSRQGGKCLQRLIRLRLMDVCPQI